ncbi:MAG: putative rhamnosyl transferase [Alphaproteobacteria bacterium]|nr:putative rhamnosyl transferase [Alphaproteobacteria bacterium]MCL2889736.1 putative rhamnosyl transferase [Alphaproteobacteria bacterium]
MTKTTINCVIQYSMKHPFADRQNIFAPDFMNYRLKLFREITLKSFLAQTDKDFNVFLYHSDDAPQNFKDIMNDLAREFPFLHNVWIKDGDEKYARPSPNDVTFENGVTINFRIDNDDALPVDFVANLRRFLRPEFAGFAISIPKITVAQRIGPDKYMTTPFDFIANSMGLAYVTTKNDYRNILTLGVREIHTRVRYEHPMILLPGGGGLQIINGKNVSNRMWKRGKTYTGEQLRKHLVELGYPDLDLTILKRAPLHLRHRGGFFRRILFHIGKTYRLMVYK